jgi:hypothetical protein
VLVKVLHIVNEHKLILPDSSYPRSRRKHCTTMQWPLPVVLFLGERTTPCHRPCCSLCNQHAVSQALTGYSTWWPLSQDADY